MNFIALPLQIVPVVCPGHGRVEPGGSRSYQVSESVLQEMQALVQCSELLAPDV